MDPGTYKMQARIMFYDFPNIYSLKSGLKPRLNQVRLDRIIVNGEFTFKVEQSPEWDRLKPQLPKTCSDQSILRGRWKSDLSSFIPFNCIIPNYEFILTKFIGTEFIGTNFRYTWIRFVGDSNTRRLFTTFKTGMGMSCVWVADDEKFKYQTCTKQHVESQFLEDDPRPREIIITFDWYYPGRYNLRTLLNNTFEENCKLHDKCVKKGPCDFVNPDTTSNNICSARRADYTFVSIGSHTPEWNDKRHDKYLEGIFKYIRENYQEKLTFITTNAANYHLIPKIYNDQFAIRNNFRIAKLNELLKKHVEKSQEEGYKIDLLDIYGTTYPIWEFSGDAVHYTMPVYEQQSRLISDKLVSYVNEISKKKQS